MATELYKLLGNSLLRVTRPFPLDQLHRLNILGYFWTTLFGPTWLAGVYSF